MMRRSTTNGVRGAGPVRKETQMMVRTSIVPRTAMVLVGLAAALTLGAVAHAQSITGLGALAGNSSSEAFGVSADGLVVVGNSDCCRAFRWTRAGGMQEVAPGLSYATARAVNADGTVIAGSGDLADGRSYGAFRWTQAGGVVPLASLPGRESSADGGVSADGTIVCGNSYTSQGPRGIRWTQADVGGGTMQDLGTLGSACGDAAFAEALGTSADGSVVVGSLNADGEPCVRHWFRWVSDGAGGGTMTDLNVLSGHPGYSRALGVSGDGAVVVGQAVSAANCDSAFRWTSVTGFQDIGPPTANPNYISEARAANADGSVVVGYFVEGPVGEHAMLWT